MEHLEPSVNAARSVAWGTTHQRAALAISHADQGMRPDSCGVGVSLGTIQEMSRAFDQPSAAPTRKELELQIHQNYLRIEKNPHSQTGANRFLAYLEGEQRSLAEVTKWDLQEWARTPIASGNGKGKMLSERVFRGAKSLCAFAAQVGYIDAPRAHDIAECTRLPIEVNVLRSQLQNPLLTGEERDYSIHRHYQMAEKNPNRQTGASVFLAYLQNQKKSLAEASTSDLGRWSLIPLPRGHCKSNLPNSDAFEGAKRLCALAAEVGYIQTQNAKDFAALTRPQCDLGSLRRVLQNHVLTRREHENHIRLYFQSVDKQHEHQAGATAILEYLESQGRSLAQVSSSDLERWALIPISTRSGKLSVPTARAFEGAKLLCAIAAEVGYIDVHRAKHLAELKRPHFGVESLRILLQNPALTLKEREFLIRLNYQSSENNPNRHTGANAFLAYLENAEISLSQVSASDLRQWALTPIKGTSNLPESQAFEGAKALCLLAAEVSFIDGQRVPELTTCTRPHFELDFLRTVLQKPGLSRNEREYHIRLNFQSLETEPNRRSGAKGIMAFLEKKARSLSEVTTRDLLEWASLPIATGKAKGRLPNGRCFEGAKALCALAAQVGHIDAQTAQNLARCVRPQGDVGSLLMLIQDRALTPKARDSHIRLHYLNAEKNPNRQVGASGFLAYLESQNMSLAEASKSDLERWALTPMSKGNRKKNLPNAPAFEGAQALCALAAELGHIAAPQAQDLALCARPRFSVESLRMVLQNPIHTREECEVQIRLNYQSSEKNAHYVNGAERFWDYLVGQHSSLAEVTKSALEEWAFTLFDTTHAKGTLPSLRAIQGAKGLCALAAEVGYIDAQRAADIAEFTLPHPGVPSTSTVPASQAGLAATENASATLERVTKRLRTDDQGASTSMSSGFAFPHSDGMFRELALSPQTASPQTLIDELEPWEDILGFPWPS